mmetsp:Transcript_90607/g.234974  ORF Transcript_90607/g.234974 Transcript_90607/m.234974 type:complete len:83 (+) Transcript_90607:308-556(+)
MTVGMSNRKGGRERQQQQPPAVSGVPLAAECAGMQAMRMPLARVGSPQRGQFRLPEMGVSAMPYSACQITSTGCVGVCVCVC